MNTVFFTLECDAFLVCDNRFLYLVVVCHQDGIGNGIGGGVLVEYRLIYRLPLGFHGLRSLKVVTTSTG